MHAPAQTLRFTGRPLLLRQPLLVGIGAAGVLALLATVYEPNPEPTGGFGWIVGLLVLLALLVAAAWLLCSSEEVQIDPVTRQVTQIHRLLHREVARNQWGFAAFTGVQVHQRAQAHTEAVTSPGSGGAKTGSRTRHTHSYRLCLLRAPTSAGSPAAPVAVPHHPLVLPSEADGDPQACEALARQVAALGGWPATRQGYVLLPGARPGDPPRASPSAAESPLEPG